MYKLPALNSINVGVRWGEFDEYQPRAVLGNVKNADTILTMGNSM